MNVVRAKLQKMATAALKPPQRRGRRRRRTPASGTPISFPRMAKE